VVFPGVVVFSSPFEDFGLTVVVHHPDRVFSLYAGLEGVAVRKGDVVSFSDVLGAARNSVYFEIRVDNRPQDPLTWLR
jgi:septal ring factor EnvC (AmiA/AmiB activator)